MRGILTIAAGLSMLLPVAAENDSERLFQAVRNNQLTGLEAAIEAGADVNARDARGSTLLMHAVAFGSADAVRLLLAKGADPNAANGLDATALIWGAGEPAKARMLVEKGADVNAQSKPGRTPLLVAARCLGCSETVRLLLDKGARIGEHDSFGNSALRLAAEADDLDTVKLLLDRGAKADVADGDGHTPLIAAAANCDNTAVRLLIGKGAAVNAANTFDGEVKFGKIQLIGLTPLMVAAPLCSAETVRILLDAGADGNAKDIRGMTALILAVASERQDSATIGALVKAGANLNGKSLAGETALDWAVKIGNPEAIALLKDAGARPGDPFTPPQRRPPAAPRDTLAAVEKGTAMLQRAGTGFFTQSGCVGCHHQPAAMRATAAARRHGARVDDAAAAGYVQMIHAESNRFGAMLLERFNPGGLAAPSMAVLTAMHDAGCPPDAATDIAAAYIASLQSADGAWRVPGLTRPPLEGSAIVSAAWGLHALQIYGFPGRKAEFDRRIAAAREFLRAARPVTNTELAMRAVGLYWSGAPEAPDAARSLLAAQRQDGGWAQNRWSASDAYATGEALWALRESGALKPADAAYRRGVRLLLATQWEDGSWYVRSRAPKFQPYFQSGFPFDHDQWISSAATALAVMALAPAIEKPAPATTATVR